MRPSNTSVETTSIYRVIAHCDKTITGFHWLDTTLNLSNPHMVLLIMGLNIFEGEEEIRKSPKQPGWYGYWRRLTTQYGDVLYDVEGKRPARLLMDGGACERFLIVKGARACIDLLMGTYSPVAWNGSLTVARIPENRRYQTATSAGQIA